MRELTQRNYKPEEIARKLGLDRAYIHGVVHLLEHSQESLVVAVEAGRLPLSVAIDIASGNDHEVQLALAKLTKGRASRRKVEGRKTHSGEAHR